MATICFIWWNFCLWPENNIWNFESLVRHSDMGILRSGGVFVIRQYGWLVMKTTKQIVFSSCVSWKNEHQTFPSLLAFLASHEAVLVLWYMCLVQLIIISFFFFCIIHLFSTSAVYLYILFRCLIKYRGQKYLRNKFLYTELFTLCTYWQEFQKESGELRTGRVPLSPRHCLSLSQSHGRKTQQLQRDPTSIQNNFICLVLLRAMFSKTDYVDTYYHILNYMEAFIVVEIFR